MASGSASDEGSDGESWWTPTESEHSYSDDEEQSTTPPASPRTHLRESTYALKTRLQSGLWGHPCLSTITEQSFRFGTTQTREGFTVLSDFRNHHLRVYRHDGTFDHNIGGPHRGIKPGAFDRPRGIAAVHGAAHPPVPDRVVVCDSGLKYLSTDLWEAFP